MSNEMIKWTKKWWNERWNDETLKVLSKGVKHTKWPSALAYDETNNEMNNEKYQMNNEMMKPWRVK